MKGWKKHLDKLIYYANGTIISLGTAWFGYHLLISNNNIIDRVDLFPPRMDAVVGWLMLILAFFKLILIFYPKQKPQKIRYDLHSCRVAGHYVVVLPKRRSEYGICDERHFDGVVLRRALAG